MKLPSRLRFIYACIFLDALGIGLIIPVLPRLIGVLTDTRDEQMWWYGAIMLSYGVMQFLASPLLGALSDRIGRRPVLLSGICGLGIMFAVPALGYERAAAFGRIGAVFGAGFLIGPALGGILGGNNPHLPFIAASIVTLLNFGYGLFVLPESIAQRSTEPVSLRKNNAFGSLAHLLKLPQIRIFVLTLAFFSLANSLMQYSWALYTEFRYGFTPLQIGLSVFALGLSISLVQGFLLQRLLARLDSVLIAVLAIACGALCLAAIGLTKSGAAATAFVCLYAVSGAVSPLLTAAISRETPLDAQGKAIGSVSSLNSLTGALAPALGTPLLMVTTNHAPEEFLAGTPYFVCAMLSALALILFIAGARRLWSKAPAPVKNAEGETSGFEE